MARPLPAPAPSHAPACSTQHAASADSQCVPTRVLTILSNLIFSLALPTQTGTSSRSRRARSRYVHVPTRARALNSLPCAAEQTSRAPSGVARSRRVVLAPLLTHCPRPSPRPAVSDSLPDRLRCRHARARRVACRCVTERDVSLSSRHYPAARTPLRRAARRGGMACKAVRARGGGSRWARNVRIFTRHRRHRHRHRRRRALPARSCRRRQGPSAARRVRPAPRPRWRPRRPTQPRASRGR